MSDINDHEPHYFFFLSGENPELAVFEFKSLISLIDVPTELRISPDKRIIELEFPLEGVKDVHADLIQNLMQRITMVHFCCKQLFQINFYNSAPLSFDELISKFNPKIVQGLIAGKTFSVDTKRIGEPIGILKQRFLTQSLSNYLGGQILRTNSDSKVNLNNPEIRFNCIINRHGFWFGQYISSSLRKDVRQRSSHKRPFFHPSSMNPLLQRTMINLAALGPGEWLLDPFCGSGGALLEASLLGIKSIGVEVDRRIVWGAYQNLRATKRTTKLTHLIYGDANHLGFKKNSISGIVTDPPYGSTASTQGVNLLNLLINFFHEIEPILRPNCRLVIAVPSTIDIEEEAAAILNATYEKFLHYVHRSLTRKIIVFTINNELPKKSQ
ncbi:MAG: DNA methyltransferase [Candidatus Hodarchaeota archaeon]